MYYHVRDLIAIWISHGNESDNVTLLVVLKILYSMFLCRFSNLWVDRKQEIMTLGINATAYNIFPI